MDLESFGTNVTVVPFTSFSNFPVVKNSYTALITSSSISGQNSLKNSAGYPSILGALPMGKY